MKRQAEIEISGDKRWWDLPAIVLLIIILTTAYSRLIATDWTEGLRVMRGITYLGIAAGMALGYSRFSPRRVFAFTFAYGLFIVPWRLGVAMGEGILWAERLQSLSGRLMAIFERLAEQRAVGDNLLFIVLMAILFWFLSVHAAYSLIRYGAPWRAIIPTGITLVAIHNYDALIGSRVWYLVFYLFFALMLVARLTFLQQQEQWKQRNTYLPPYLGIDFVRLTLAATTIVLLFSWVTPGLAETLPAAREVWQRANPIHKFRNTFDNAFASLRSTVGIVSDYYGPNLTLGRGNRLSDSHVFTVITPPEPPDGVRFYWRARVYDFYENGWSSNLLTTRTVEPDNFDLSFSNISQEDLYTFSFSLGTPLATLFTMNQPVWLSRPAKLELAYNPDGSADLAALRATPPLRAGETYQIRSALRGVTISELRAAGTDYPDWVRQRYLQVPDTITTRTLELARFIAEGKETPYDIAVAITGYLRREIEYTDIVPPLPADQEIIDWFLFDLRQGFCNYYASAEVILLRSLGIPARLAVGYAQGERLQGIPDAYIVRQRDAHAWPEVYFPGIGWVEFEPTVSQPSLVRPLGEFLTDRDDPGPQQLPGRPLGGPQRSL